MIDTLTPSEIAFVHGEQFSKAKKDGVKLPRGGVQVDPDTLAVSMLTAALLANERAGALRMEIGIEKYLFGLLKRRVVHVIPAGSSPNWPAGTLEARVWSFASTPPKAGHWSVRDLVRGLFPSDDPNPYIEVAVWVRKAMEGRGLADEVVEEKKSLGIFTVKYTHAELTAAGTAAANRQSAAPVQEMISAAARERSEVAERMGNEIKSALSSRVESSSSDSGSDFGSDSSSD